MQVVRIYQYIKYVGMVVDTVSIARYKGHCGSRF